MDINERRKPNNTWQFPASCIAVQVKLLEVMEFLAEVREDTKLLQFLISMLSFVDNRNKSCYGQREESAAP